jgi:hypothetical protein
LNLLSQPATIIYRTAIRDSRLLVTFAAYVASCAPAAVRIHAEPLKGTLEATARLLDAQGLFGRAPASLGNKSMTELLAEGTVHFS